MSRPLTIIYNKRLSEGMFPDLWKEARIICLYKKGDILYTENDRPMFNLSSFYKTFERYLKEWLSSLFDHLNLKEHDGFQYSRSTVRSLLEFTNLLRS